MHAPYHVLEEKKMCALKERLHGELIVTCGADGAAYLSNNKFYHIPALKIIKLALYRNIKQAEVRRVMLLAVSKL